MDMNQAIASKWMSNTDVPLEGADLTISSVTQEAVGEMMETKYAVHWRETDYKPLLLNKTNIRVLIAMMGPDSKGWTGKRVNVFNDMSVSYQGKVGGTRVRQAAAAAPGGLSKAELEAAAKAYLAAQNGTKTIAELEDSIPF